MLASYRQLPNTRSACRSIALAVALAALPLSGCGNGKDDDASAASPSASASASASAPASASASPSAAANASATASLGEYPRAFKDELGHELTLPAVPTRIFAPSMEDALLSLGVVPVAQWANGSNVQDYLQDRLAGVPKADFSGGLPSPETVMAYKPDLIVLNNSYYAENGVYEQYSKIAPTYVFNNAATNLTSSVGQLGALLDREAEAAKALEDYRAKAEEAKQKLGALAEGKKAAIIRFNAKGMFLVGGDYFGGYVLAHDLGFGKVKPVEKESSADMSLELLPDLDADYIFLVNDSHSGDAFVKELTDSALWKNMKQVKEGHTYEVVDESWLSGGLIASGKVVDQTVGLLAP